MYGNFNSYGGNPYQNFNAENRLKVMENPNRNVPAPNPIIWVSGIAGARAFQLLEGSTVLLMDSEDSKFYIKQCSESGVPDLKAFTFEECEIDNSMPGIDTSKFATKEDFQTLKSDIDKAIAIVTSMVGNIQAQPTHTTNIVEDNKVVNSKRASIKEVLDKKEAF